jgi:(2R)-3-sulfolactate dehydrogenase (NADP+)
MNPLISVTEARNLGLAVLAAVNAPPAAAGEVIDSLLLAELDGIPSHGFSRLPFYADQALSGKIRTDTVPSITEPAPGVVLVDACNGFAFPAITAGLAKAIPKAGTMGVCSLGVKRSHHCGVLGHFVEKIALNGLLGLGFTNSPAAMAPWGGTKAVFGTNPIAFACPRPQDDPIVVDLSLSKVARGKVMLAKQRGDSIPPDWAFDREGKPTTDPAAALQGAMAPLGEAKGAALALMVEILSATLTGSNHASEAGSFFSAEGPPPGIGQFFLLISPQPFGSGFFTRLESLCAEIVEQDNVRLPGTRRRELRENRKREGIRLPDELLADLRRRAGSL